jgi:hypothetical protein
MRQLQTTIDIEAPPERVWSILTDLPAFSEWNPFIREARGELQPGAELAIRIQPPGGRPIRFRPTVLKVDPGRELRWLGRTGVRGIFDGEHVHHLEPVAGDGTRYTQSERFSGVFTWFAGGILKKTLVGFAAMNAALKQRVEGTPMTDPASEGRAPDGLGTTKNYRARTIEEDR